MGNRLNKRTRRTDQPYPQPEHPGDFSKQDRNRNSQPRHPGDFSHVSHQDGDRISRPEHPGASLKQDGDRNPQPGHLGASVKQDGDRNPRPRHPGDFPHQDGDRSPRPEHSVASLHRNEGTCLSIILILSSMFNSRILYPSGEGILSMIVVDEMLIFTFPCIYFWAFHPLSVFLSCHKTKSPHDAWLV